MFRHVIAPARFFSQLPNEIIRRPRLSSDAVRLLAWQLSLPEGADEPLSKSARRAGIKRTAFQKAKRQLIAEGYLHEWRCQGEGGRWQTVQLIANVSLTAEDAAAVRSGDPARPSPAATSPTIGQPAGRTVGRQPLRKTREEKTLHPPVADERAGAVADAEAKALLLSLGRLDARLAIPARKAARWAPLAAEWLSLGLTHAQIRQTLMSGLNTARSPLRALLWRLKHALPCAVEPMASTPQAAPRVARMRECTGSGHAHPRLFRPTADEAECPACAEAALTAPPPPRTQGAGFRAYLAARHEWSRPQAPAPA